MNLYIAEKPSLARTIAQSLGIIKKGNGYIKTKDGYITWCFGHMYENFQPQDYDMKYKNWIMDDLPIIPEEFILKVKETCVDQLEIINGLISKAEVIVNCGDPDREGQLLVDEVINMSDSSDKIIKRAWLKDLSSAGLEKTLNNLEPNSKYKPMSDSAKARSHLDWLTGINLTRAYTLQAKSRGLSNVLSVGRVQTPTLKLVVDRDNEIDDFNSIEFYEIQGTFLFNSIEFNAKYVIPDEFKDLNKRLIEKTSAENEINKLNTVDSFLVYSKTTKNKKQNPPKLFSLGDLQAHCSKKFGYSAKEVLDIAQALYETHKITSYPRSDCNYLSEGGLAECKQTVSKISGQYSTFIDDNKNPSCFDDKKVTAHTAIIPNGNESEKMNDKESNVYHEICLRFLVQYCEPYEYSETEIILKSDDYVFQTKGKEEINKGFKHILPDSKKNEDENIIPGVTKGDEVKHKNSELIIKKTTPPKRFTEGTIITAMSNIAKTVENKDDKDVLAEVGGLGTEATRAETIETLKQREYLVTEKKNILSTTRAKNFINLMIDDIKSPTLTAQWEKLLSKIEQGELEYSDFIENQKKWIIQICAAAKKTDLNHFGGKKCPKCADGYLSVRKGKKGNFIGCTKYPDCDFASFPNAKKSKNKFKITRRKRK
ncbi:MAG: DNA topoisomerase 3 [Flavobacteriaceae bacterium]